MKKTAKTEIKTIVKDALTEVVQHLKIGKPSRKTKKALSKAAKALRSDLKGEMKKLTKKAALSSTPRKAKVAVTTA